VPSPQPHESAPTVDDLRRTADRCDELAQTAELMGDDAGAVRLRDTALLWRMRAMHLLDHATPPRAAREDLA
jgi:hypothetical protein